MTRTARVLAFAVWLGGGALAFGCQSIVGIEDRTVDTCDSQCELCEDYCDLVMQNCTGGFAVYKPEARGTCIGICKELPPGDTSEPRGNTVACRMHQAELAASTGEPDEHCPGAGPGGGNLCGSDCESYCYLFPRICPGGFPNDVCLDKCRALEDSPEYNVEEYYDADTLECRLIHLGNATSDPATHCGHADFQSNLHCMPPLMEPPDCADYCRVVMVACQAERQVYDDTATCLATCEALPPGLNGDTSENTAGCRQYHSYSSLLDPVTHCSHAGPGGSGHCGESGGVGNCESYCTLVQTGCPSEYAAAFTSAAACRAACEDLEGAKDDANTTDVDEEEQYSVGFAEAGSAYACRLLHVTRALLAGGDDATECASAVGAAGSACPP